VSIVASMVALVLLAGCTHHPPPKEFSADAPFSRTFSGAGDAVCWSVKRALLSQGYMLDRANDAGVMTGARDEQPKPKLNVTTRLQTTCADNRNGTSIVFVTATREENDLQKMKQSTSLGVGPATLTMPSGSAKVLGTVRRETITDRNFYAQFFALVQGYVDQERLSQSSVLPASRPSALRSDPPQVAPTAEEVTPTAPTMPSGRPPGPNSPIPNQ
jgi:hypothetical protein